jgi:hypothetical protein
VKSVAEISEGGQENGDAIVHGSQDETVGDDEDRRTIRDVVMGSESEEERKKPVNGRSISEGLPQPPEKIS